MAKKPLIISEESLRAEVAEQYSIPEGRVLIFACEFGEVDLTKINLEFAARLEEKGYLIKRS